MIFEPDLVDFIELLNNHKVAYMVIGAHALAYHGRPRHTGDWIFGSNQRRQCSKNGCRIE